MSTKTVEDWSKYVGLKPYRMGVVARMYTDNTLSFIMDGLRNVYYKDEKPSNFTISTSMMFEWEIETNNIKHVEFAEVPTENGENGSEITMAFKENYYQKYDIFRIDKSKQQCIVVSHPIRKNDAYWEVQVRLIDNNYDSTLDIDSCLVGDTTTFQSVAVPELSEEGNLLWNTRITLLGIFTSNMKTPLTAGKLNLLAGMLISNEALAA